MPAPTKNRNRLQHGLRSLINGRLPKGASYIAAVTRKMSNEIAAAVTALRGGTTLADAALIQTAERWERHALLCQWWLRKNAETLNPEQLLRFSRDVCLASDRRDKAIQQLGIDRRDVTRSQWDGLTQAKPAVIAEPPTLLPAEAPPASDGSRVIPARSDAAAGQAGAVASMPGDRSDGAGRQGAATLAEWCEGPAVRQPASEPAAVVPAATDSDPSRLVSEDDF